MLAAKILCVTHLQHCTIFYVGGARYAWYWKEHKVYKKVAKRILEQEDLPEGMKKNLVDSMHNPYELRDALNNVYNKRRNLYHNLFNNVWNIHIFKHWYNRYTN